MNPALQRYCCPPVICRAQATFLNFFPQNLLHTYIQLKSCFGLIGKKIKYPCKFSAFLKNAFHKIIPAAFFLNGHHLIIKEFKYIP